MFEPIYCLVNPTQHCSIIRAHKSEQNKWYIGLGEATDDTTKVIGKLLTMGYDDLETYDAAANSSQLLVIAPVLLKGVSVAVLPVPAEPNGFLPLPVGNGFCIMPDCTHSVSSCPLGQHPDCDCQDDANGPPKCIKFAGQS